MSERIDVITAGRVGVDIDPLQTESSYAWPRR
jgi:hypothetical protein